MKKLYKMMAVVAMVAAIGFITYNAQKDDLQMSSLAMANIEALASGESDGYCHTTDNYSHICNYYDKGPICPCGF